MACKSMPTLCSSVPGTWMVPSWT